jgi:hypothetical protein
VIYERPKIPWRLKASGFIGLKRAYFIFAIRK